MSVTTETTSTHDKAEGSVHQVKGGLKEKWGQVTNNPDLVDEGTTERVTGKIQEKVGQIKQVFDK